VLWALESRPYVVGVIIVEQRSSIHLGLTYLLIFDLFVQASFYVMANADADDVFQSTDEITRREIFFLANDFLLKR